MDHLLQQLYSRISHLGQKTIKAIKPVSSFEQLHSRTSRISTLVEMTNYSQISQKVQTQISRRIINIQKIKQIGSQTYDRITADIGAINMYKTNLQQFPQINKHISQLQQKQQNKIKQLTQQYHTCMKNKYTNQSSFDYFTKQHIQPYAQCMYKQIIPQYCQLLQHIKIPIFSPINCTQEISTLQQYKSISDKLTQILTKFRSILSIEYQQLISYNKNYEQQSHAALSFLAKLKELFTEVGPFICKQNCMFVKVFLYAHTSAKHIINRIRAMYYRYVHDGNAGYNCATSNDVKYNRYKYQQNFILLQQLQQSTKQRKIKQTPIINDWCIYSHYNQISLQVNKYIFIKIHIHKQITSIQQLISDISQTVYSIISKPDKKARPQPKIQKCKQLIKWNKKLLSMGKCVYFSSVFKLQQKQMIKIIMLQQVLNKIQVFVQNDLSVCVNFINKIDKIKNLQSQSDLKLNQLNNIQLNNYMEYFKNMVKLMKWGNQMEAIVFHNIKLYIQTKIQQIPNIRHHISEQFNLANFNLNIQTKSQTKLKQQTKLSQSSKKIGPYLVNQQKQKPQKKLIKLQIYQIVKLLQETSQFFDNQLKQIIGSGFQLAVIHLQSKKANSEDKSKKLKNRVDRLLNKYIFDKSIIEGENGKKQDVTLLNVLRKQTKGQIRIDQSVQQSQSQQNKQKVQNKKINLRNQVMLAQANLKNVSELLYISFGVKNGQSIVSFAEQCLNFQFQDWSKRIKSFEIQLKIFESKCKQIHLLLTSNMTTLFPGVYKIFKEYIGVIQVMGDIFHQILFIFKNCKQLETQRKGSFSSKPLNIWEQIDLTYLQGLISYKLKMVDQISQLEKFNYIHRSARNYLKSVYIRFKNNFDWYIPYSDEALKRVTVSVQTANSLKQNHVQIFQTFIEVISKPLHYQSRTQIHQISKQINRLQKQSISILKIQEAGIPINLAYFQQLKKIINTYTDQFRLAEMACDLFNGQISQIKDVKFSNGKIQGLYNKILQAYKIKGK